MSAAGKKQRLSAKECREHLIEAGMEALAESGLSLGLDAVTLEQAVRDAEVPRSSAYAAWSADEQSPQESFQRAVLMRAIATRRETLEALIGQVSEAVADPPGDLTGRALFRELVRVGGKYNLHNALESQGWRIIFAVRAIANTGSPEAHDPELREWLAHNEEELRNETVERFYKPFGEVFGLRPRPQYDERAWHLLEIAHSSLVEGLSMRSSLDASGYFDGLINLHDTGGEANWSIYALLFDHFVDTFFEFDEL